MASVQATNQELAACFGAGVFLHLVVFRKGEWDDYSFAVLKAAATVQALLTWLAHQYLLPPPASAWDALRHASLWAASALAGLYASILLYRAFFHRLARFPGPFAARLSTLPMTWRSFRRGQLYEDVRALHARHGDYVRVGPTEVSVADPAAFLAVHAAASQCGRGPWYNILNPTVSLQMVRDNKEHARRRKAWDRGFGARALRDYEGRVALYTDELLGAVEREKGGKLNAAKWFK